MGRLRVERNVSRGQLISYVMREREEAPWIFMRGRDVSCVVCAVRGGVVAGPAPALRNTQHD